MTGSNDGFKLHPGRSRARVLSKAVVVSVLLALGLSAQPARALTTAITLKPSVGPPTTKVTMTGTGFGASETVTVDFDATQVASATASSAGSFSTAFNVPKSALPGEHVVKASGGTSGLSATQNFLVETNWVEFHFGPTETGFNPYENVIGPGNVSGLTTAWTAATGGVQTSSPAVVNGVVYIGSTDHKLYAFSASGSTNCSGTPKTCAPLWTGTTGSKIYSSPAVANGVVYVASFDHKVYAFSASGTTNCSGTPKTCAPLWTGTTGSYITSSPTVAGGVAYVGSHDGKLYAFSAAGTTNCSGTPKTCAPLWTGAVAGVIDYSSPAVANGDVYVGSTADTFYAFSASGTTNCAGTPKTCTPLWSAPTAYEVYSSPAVGKGVVYAASYYGTVYAFSTSGTLLWSTAKGGYGNSSSPAVAGSVVYLGSYAYSASGSTNCSGSPKICSPLWNNTFLGIAYSSTAVAGGVDYIGSRNGKLYAFSASGNNSCSGTPKLCMPLWIGDTTSETNGIGIESSPAVANGVVYVGASDGKLYAFSL